MADISFFYAVLVKISEVKGIGEALYAIAKITNNVLKSNSVATFSSRVHKKKLIKEAIKKNKIDPNDLSGKEKVLLDCNFNIDKRVSTVTMLKNGVVILYNRYTLYILEDGPLNFHLSFTLDEDEGEFPSLEEMQRNARWSDFSFDYKVVDFIPKRHTVPPVVTIEPSTITPPNEKQFRYTLKTKTDLHVGDIIVVDVSVSIKSTPDKQNDDTFTLKVPIGELTHIVQEEIYGKNQSRLNFKPLLYDHHNNEIPGVEEDKSLFYKIYKWEQNYFDWKEAEYLKIYIRRGSVE